MDTQKNRYILPAEFKQDCELALMPIPGKKPNLSIWPDISGNGRDGAISGATWVLGPLGWELDFDATDDSTATPSFSLGSGGALTFSFLVKSSVHATVISTFINKSEQSAANPFIFIYRAALEYHLTFQYCDGDSFELLSATNIFTLANEGKYVLITVVADYDNGIVKFYRNKDFVIGFSGLTMVYPSANSIAYLGSYQGSAHYSGDIALFKGVWSRAFTEQQIKDFHTWIRGNWPPAFV